MYAPSRHDGRAPSTTSHSVGGSSSTGAKFADKTWRGSTDCRTGGSMKVLMNSSKPLNIRVGNETSAGGLRDTAVVFLGGGGFRVCSGSCSAGRGVCFVVVTVFSSILTDETLRIVRLGGEGDLFLGKEIGRVERKEEEEKASIFFCRYSILFCNKNV
nr:hypothetical protein VIGAN_10135300 [Ipomoea trifida]